MYLNWCCSEPGVYQTIVEQSSLVVVVVVSVQ